MKHLLIALLTLAASACGTLAQHGTVNPDPLRSLFDPNAGIPVFEKGDLQAAHAILSQAVANGASPVIAHKDQCVVAFLTHPEFQTGTVAATPTAPPMPATAGVVSSAAAFAVQADADARALRNKVVLVEAGLPDDIVTGCALFVHDLQPTGVLASLNKFLHPAAASNPPGLGVH